MAHERLRPVRHRRAGALRGILPLLCAAAILAGCLEDRSATTLQKDGRGTFVQTTVVHMDKAEEYVKHLRAQVRGLGGPQEDGDLDPFEAIDTRKRARALATRKGIRVTTHAQSADEERKTRTFELRVAFESLEALYRAGVVEDVSVKLESVREGAAWKLTVRHAFEGSDREPLQGEAAERLRALRESMLKRYEPMWGSMQVESTLHLPTAVLETNGTRAAEGHAVTWRIGFKDLADPAKLVQEVTFAASADLKLKAFELTANDIANAIEEAELAAEEKDADEKKAKDER